MLKVKLFQDGKTREYTEGVAENLEKSGRGKILGKVNVTVPGADVKKGRGGNRSGKEKDEKKAEKEEE